MPQPRSFLWIALHRQSGKMINHGPPGNTTLRFVHCAAASILGQISNRLRRLRPGNGNLLEPHSLPRQQPHIYVAGAPTLVIAAGERPLRAGISLGK